ncbi:hypothetical protein CS063_16455 [Sporanaerobium hydrogeniformans]|uniref:Uncharacterized protein n=1 Tax=Sporanaerobium hydrogeniformans TaxID=3072179 RepID=A0AC61D939_9FIRM|nr:ABC transporter permease [Sporanaerobium hydrogeniformans]PHV69305.1 hypothetical protein CS063_16455 [Sporanaerobium hydrogeniformans]
MKAVTTLTIRNMKLYIRDHTAVFFSMLTIIIIIVLNIVFLGKMNVDAIMTMQLVDREKAAYLINTWVLAGIVFTSTVTIPFVVMGIMIEDEESKIMMGFFVAPISRLKLALGYIIASIMMGCILSFITLGISQIFIIGTGGELLSLTALIKMGGVIIISVFSNACMVFFFTTFMSTSSSFSALNMIVGTLIGFITGIYLPIGLLPKTVQQVMKSFPGLYGAVLMREIYVEDAMKEVFQGAPLQVAKDYAQYMGISVVWNGQEVNLLCKLLILLGSGILFIVLSALVLSKKKGTDR